MNLLKNLGIGLYIVNVIALFSCPLHGQESQIGDLYIVGSNAKGQLGINRPTFITEFENFESNIANVAMSERVTQLLKKDGTLWVLGTDLGGALGVGELDVSTFNARSIAANVKSVHGGEFTSTFFINEANELFATGTDSPGSNKWGLELSEQVLYLDPTKIYEGVLKVKSSQTMNGYLFEENELKASGFGTFNLGLPNSSKILDVASDIVDFDVHSSSLVYVDEAKKLWSVGLGINGYNPIGSSYLISENVISVTTNKKGNLCVLFIKSDGTLWGVGANIDGRLGLGEQSFASEPTKVADNVLRVFSYDSTTFFLDTSDKLWGMGKNDTGQLGLGDQDNRYLPTLIANNVADAATNGKSSVVVLRDGTAMGTGDMSFLSIGKEPHYSLSVESTNNPILLEPRVTHFKTTSNTAFFVNELGHLKVSGGGTRKPLSVTSKITSLYDSPKLARSKDSILKVNYKISNFLDDQSNRIVTLAQSDLDPVKYISPGEYGDEVYILENEELWFRGEPNTIRVIGAEQAPNLLDDIPTKIADGIVDAAFGDSLFTLSSDGTLKTFGWNILNEMNFSGLDTSSFPDGELVIDTNVDKVWGSGRLVVYKKADNSLWGVGFNYSFSPVLDVEDEFVLTPVQIDNDVKKAAPIFGSLVYQKTNGSLWMKGRDPWNFEHNEERENNLLDVPTEIYAELDVIDFEYSSGSLLLLLPSDNNIATRDEVLIHSGDSATLALNEWESPNSIAWYQGQIGDRTTQIENASNEVTVQPLEDQSYWVEYNTENSVNLTKSIEVRIIENSFNNWASYYGLYKYEESVDTDKDLIPDRLEYAFNFDPLVPTTESPIKIILPSRDSIDGHFLLPVNSELLNLVSIQQLTNSETWETLDLESYIDDDSIRIPFSTDTEHNIIRLSIDSE